MKWMAHEPLLDGFPLAIEPAATATHSKGDHSIAEGKFFQLDLLLNLLDLSFTRRKMQ